MRVQSDPENLDFVTWISQLPYDPALNGAISLPPYVPQAQSILELISGVYPTSLMAQALSDYTVFRGRAILSTLNSTVSALNHEILQLFPGDSRTYLSADSADGNGDGLENIQFPPEYLRTIETASLPPSRLELKIGAPIIIIRNLCAREGLCNGTRLVVTRLEPHCIQGRILGGDFDRQLRLLPRIKLSSSEEDSLGFTLTRGQFPVRLSFAMTINKSQGQSFDTIGLDLRTPVFSHGQFYVAVSRVRSAKGLSVLLPEGATTTWNVVYPEVLQDIE
jgi:PIF1-like helicase/Helicase